MNNEAIRMLAEHGINCLLEDRRGSAGAAFEEILALIPRTPKRGEVWAVSGKGPNDDKWLVLNGEPNDAIFAMSIKDSTQSWINRSQFMSYLRTVEGLDA